MNVLVSVLLGYSCQCVVVRREGDEREEREGGREGGARCRGLAHSYLCNWNW